MHNSSTTIKYESTSEWTTQTRHSMFLSFYEFTRRLGVFKHWGQIPWKMKTVTYQPLDKLKVLWASIAVGCQHTYEINDQLGKHELALAQVFGLKSFPDQSQINRLLTAVTDEQVEQLRSIHLNVLCGHTGARHRRHWTRLANGRRVLMVDLDQRGLTVQGKQFELAKEGYFSHRGRRGYQLTAMFFGGAVGELVNEYFDPGDMSMIGRLGDLLETLAEICERVGLKPEDIVIRSDAQLGTPAAIREIEAFGFGYLLKGLSPQRAKLLVTQTQEVFWRVKAGSENRQRWLADLGVIEHRDQSEHGRGQKVWTRTLVQVRCERRQPTRKGKHCKRVCEAHTVVRNDYYLTSLSAEELPLEAVVPLYDDRATIERYFYDEEYALGARQVRTRHFAGEAFFELLVAFTNNLLKWYRQKEYKKTPLEKFGLKRLVTQVMQIPGRIIKEARSWKIIVPEMHYLIKQLEKSWQPMMNQGGD